MNALSEPQEVQVAPALINGVHAYIGRLEDKFQRLFLFVRWILILGTGSSLYCVAAYLMEKINTITFSLACLNVLLLIPVIFWFSSALELTYLYFRLSNLIYQAQASQVHLPSWNGSEQPLSTPSDLIASFKSLIQWISALSNDVNNLKNALEIKSSLDTLVCSIKSLIGAFNPLSIIIVSGLIFISTQLSLILSMVLFF